MTTQHNPTDLLAHPTVRSIIRRTAGQLARRRDFSRDDLEDIAGALRVLIATRLRHFDPARAPLAAFAASVARSAAASLVRERHRDRRRASLHTSSFDDVPPTGASDAPCADTVSDADAARRRGVDVGDAIDDLITRRSIDEIVARLDPDLVIVIRMLREDTPFAAAKRLGISRRRMRVLIADLREHFVAGGFGD